MSIYASTDPDSEDFDWREYESCMTCGGEGSGPENELEADGVNYGPEWVVCPDCKGTGRETKGRG